MAAVEEYMREIKVKSLKWVPSPSTVFFWASTPCSARSAFAAAKASEVANLGPEM